MDEKPKKFCKHCGQPIDAECVICPHCGKQVEELKGPQVQQAAPQTQPNIIINNANANTNTNTVNGMAVGPMKSKMTALLLCFFFGMLGIHRFYVGKVGTGLIWMVTLGLFGVGWVIDFIMILVGSFRDKFGRPLV